MVFFSAMQLRLDSQLVQNVGVHPGIDFAFEQQLSDVHLVLWFKEQNYCLTLPFQKEDQDTPSGSVPNPKPDDRQQV